MKEEPRQIKHYKNHSMSQNVPATCLNVIFGSDYEYNYYYYLLNKRNTIISRIKN